MQRLKEFLQWHIDNPHNINFKSIVTCEEREDTLKAMKDMVELLDVGESPEDIKEFLVIISEDATEVDENGIDTVIIRDLIELQAYRNTSLTPKQIHNQKHNLGIAYNIISGYEQCIREIFKRQQEHNGRQYIDAEEAAGIIDKIMSGRLKEVKR